MKKIVDYKIITEDKVSGFHLQIDACLRNGYQPYGSPFDCGHGYSVFLCQAMVKYDESK